jgi:(E)-4-hydroxy-3-methylbut-2-enyl-diphosphate synthase
VIPEKRRRTRRILVGGVPVGGGAPVAVQSMTKTDTADVTATLRQVRALARAGCALVRIGLRDADGASALARIVGGSPVPIIADIHFDPDLAYAAIDAGISGIRLNPGTMAREKDFRAVLRRCAGASVAVRMGANAGSLPKDLAPLAKEDPAGALVETALRGAAVAAEEGVVNVKVSLKSSSVPDTVEAYRRFSKKSDLPLHLGITEAGPLLGGTVKSAVGLGILLAGGIGDTIRVSLTAPPVKEVEVGYDILRCLGLHTGGVNLVSCPTCGRCRADLAPLVSQVERALKGVTAPVTVAVMGCEVNGPGEAAGADVGFAGGKNSGILFSRGKVLRKVTRDEALSALVAAVHEFTATKEPRKP